MKFILLGLLFLGVFGLVMLDMGDSYRSGPLRNDIAKVGHEKISIQEFDNNIRRQLSQMRLPIESAYQLGFIDRLLQADIRRRILGQSAGKHNIRISDELVSAKLREQIDEVKREDQSYAEALDQVLRQAGISKGAYINSQRQTMAIGIMQSLLTSAPLPTTGIAQTLAAYDGEARQISMLTFPYRTAKIEEPEEEILEGFYISNQDAYQTPELRDIRYAILDADSVKQNIELDEDTLRDEYDASRDSLMTPERRTIDQAVIADEAQAQAVVEVLETTSLKEAVQNVTGSTSAYIGEGKFSKDGLSDEMGAAVFAAGMGEAVGPYETQLGWQVAVVKDTTPASIPTFEDVKDTLREEMIGVLAEEQLYDTSIAIEDALAGGASFDGIVGQFGLDDTTISNMNVSGFDENRQDALATFGDSRALVLEEAVALENKDISQVIELDDGRFVIVTVEAVSPAQTKPYEEVKDRVRKQWFDTARQSKRQQEVKAYLDALEKGQTTLKEIATLNGLIVQTSDNLTRQNTAEENAAIPANVARLGFEVMPGTYAQTADDNGQILFHVDDVDLPESADELKLAALALQTQQELEAALLDAYVNTAAERYNVQINRAALDAMYGSGAE